MKCIALSLSSERNSQIMTALVLKNSQRDSFAMFFYCNNLSSVKVKPFLGLVYESLGTMVQFFHHIQVFQDNYLVMKTAISLDPLKV